MLVRVLKKEADSIKVDNLWFQGLEVKHDSPSRRGVDIHLFLEGGLPLPST
jgi:hypothetical protein